MNQFDEEEKIIIIFFCEAPFRTRWNEEEKLEPY